MSDWFADQPWHIPGCECRHDDNGHATTTDQTCVEWTAIVREALRTHDAEVGERIAQAIEAERPEMGPDINVNSYRHGRDTGLAAAARIARAETGAGQ